MNKKISIFLILLISILFSFGYAQEKISEGAKIINKMKFPEISFKVPQIGREIEKYTLPNGLTFLIMPDHELPVINIDVIIKAGEVFEEKDKFGTASLCAESIRSGGTKNYTPDYIDKELDYKSVIIDFSAGTDYMGGGLNVLSKDFDASLKIFADMLINPMFDEEKFKIDKIKFLDNIARIEDEPSLLSRYKFYNFVYGKHPYGWEYKKDVIEKININDLKNWHGRYFAPNNMIMAVSGDFNADDLKKKLNEVFGSWGKKDVTFSDISEPVEVSEKKCLIINKKLTQATIYIGNLGIRAGNPDIIPISVMNNILGGGGFTSRLWEEVREKRGLSYGVGSAFDYPKLYDGLFKVKLSTKSPKTAEAINVVLDVINGLKEKGVTDEELKQAKNEYLNKFVFGFTNASETLYKFMLLEFYNLPRDYYDNYIKNVEKVTKEDILRCARTYLHPEKIKIVIVGNEKKIKADVEKILPVTE